MEEKRLNTANIDRAMATKGMNASAVAGALGVSRTIVSEWLRGLKLPRPRYLLELSKLLDLPYDSIVLRDRSNEPVVAYRKHGHAKLREEDEERAKGLGKAVGLLVPYLPFKRLNAPARLIEPRNEAVYVEQAAEETRAQMGAVSALIRFEEVITLFNDLKAVLVPVLWGEKDSLDNALHVYLPDSQTTIVYLNLDTKLFDFKFWMLHELGHAKTFGLLDGEEAEKFADSFASEVLVPRRVAEAEYAQVKRLGDAGGRINRVLSVAKELIVSPITIAKRIDAVARAHGETEPIGRAIYGAAANFNKEYGLVSSTLFDSDRPEAADLVRVSEAVFKTPIYAALRSYLAERGKTEGIVAASLGVGPADAKAVLSALS